MSRAFRAGRPPSSLVLYSGSTSTAGPSRVHAEQRGVRVAGAAVDAVNVYQAVIPAGAFTGLTYDVTLPSSIDANYFAIVVGQSDEGGSQAPDAACARIIGDEHGSGSLTTVAAGTLRLQRASSDGSWSGTVIVVEDPAGKLFTLLDVVEPVLLATASAGPQTVGVASGTAWSSIDAAGMIGGIVGGGVECNASSSSGWNAAHVKVSPSGTTGVDATRNGVAGTLNHTTTTTVYVVEFDGEGVTARRGAPSWPAGAVGLGAGSHGSASLGPQFAADRTMVLGSTMSYEGAENELSASITFGDGDEDPPVGEDYRVSVGRQTGGEATYPVEAEVIAVSHPRMRVQRYKLQRPVGELAAIDAPVSNESVASGTITGHRLLTMSPASPSRSRDAWDGIRAWAWPAAPAVARLDSLGEVHAGVLQVVDFGNL